MGDRKGRSEKKKDWLGNTYVQHYNSKGEKSGKSEFKKDWLGNSYTQHQNSKGEKTGKSENKKDWLGNNYTQKYNSRGEKSGKSENKKDWLGNNYTQHYNKEGEKTGTSKRKSNWLGNKFTERVSDENKTTSYSDSSGGSGKNSNYNGYAPGYFNSARNNKFGFGKFLFIICCIFLCIGIIRTLTQHSPHRNITENDSPQERPNSSPQVSTPPQYNPPPALVVATGACPFEGCQLGKWIARETITVYEHPGGSLKKKLHSGETVYATSAEVRAVPQKAVITKTYKSDENHGLKVGNSIYVLYPIGEGAVAVWNEGKIIHGSLDLGFRYVDAIESRPLQWTWWVQVRLADGTTGWLQNPQGHLEGMDTFG